MQIKVSAKSARLKFNGCDELYIRNVCHGRCCKSKSAPGEVLVTIMPIERTTFEGLGATMNELGMLQPVAWKKGCQFHEESGLCGIHMAGLKPWQCRVSPFTLTSRNTLIVMNRYVALNCYNDGFKMPAYRAFHASLVAIFGEEETQRLTAHFDAGGDDCMAEISQGKLDDLLYKKSTYKATLKKGAA